MMVPQGNGNSFLAFCDDMTNNDDWLVIQSRTDGSVNFNRTWLEYENGFGQVDGEYWLGLSIIYALTNFNGPQELYIELEDFDGTKKYAKYAEFKIGNENQKYKLEKLSGFSGTADDSLAGPHLGMPFSTFDQDNDKYSTENCAVRRGGGWWFNDKCGKRQV